MRVVICWPQISGYMAACWRELAKQPDLDLLVLALGGGSEVANAPFEDGVVHGISCRLLDRVTANNPKEIADIVVSFEPDVVFVSGWIYRGYFRLPFDPRLAEVPFVTGFDNPRKDTLRQRLARLKLGRFIDRMDRVIVPGERAWQFARFLKVPETKLRRGLYAVDYEAFAQASEVRQAVLERWPRRFLFVGQYSVRKGLDVLLEAYRKYRQHVEDPWPLSCCGKGELADLLSDVEGIEDKGFVQPADLPDVLARHGVFVLPSRHDAWGTVVAEAGASQLPILCTESCGATVELVRPFYNGLTVTTGDVEALTGALCWMHEHVDLLPEMGRRSQQMAAPYSTQMWAIRWMEMFREVVGPQSTEAARTAAVAH